MSILIFIGICFLLFAFPYLRILVTHFFSFISLSFKDIFKYIFKFQFNVCPSGKIVCYAGLFGYGKTLSAVHHVVSLYKRYNNKKCFVNGKWRIQKIMILSNVNLLSIPYVPFVSLSQITEFTKLKAKLDNDKYYYVCLVLGDEFSTCLNSRSFKNNIDPLFLNTLVTCRHYAISLFYTSQRFNLVDKLLRDVTFFVVQCRKIGRIELNNYYDAYDLENCSNTTMIRAFKRTGFFIYDKDYNSYDTLAVVDNLRKWSDQGDMLSENEIINKLNPNMGSIENVSKLSHRAMKRFRRQRK